MRQVFYTGGQGKRGFFRKVWDAKVNETQGAKMGIRREPWPHQVFMIKQMKHSTVMELTDNRLLKDNGSCESTLVHRSHF